MLKIASIGDVCVDVYPKENKFFLGGTAFNRAKWLAQNGVSVSLVSAVGTDGWGKKYLSACRKLKINTDFLTVLPGLTSQVEIALDQNQSPVFSAWQLGVLQNFRPKTWPKNQDAVIATGLKPINKFLDLPPTNFSVADFDGDSPYAFSNAQIKNYANRFNLIATSAGNGKLIKHPMVLYTLGSHGSKLIIKGKEYFVPAGKIITQDTTGAGDVYIAAFVINFLKTKDITLSMNLATQAAAKAITSPRYLSV